MKLTFTRWTSPVSPLLIVADETGALRALEFGDQETRLHRLLRNHYKNYTLEEGPAPKAIMHALTAYFQGDLTALKKIPTATGGTDFQRAVWQALRAIPAGTTQSYNQIATQLGRPTANRAVGAANGANPISIVVPCHRVISASGALTGYAGGLLRKRWLLDHERQFAAKNGLI